MNFIVSAATDIGLTKQTNQDSYAVRVCSTNRGKMVFAILCDGMGGLEKGEVASASVVRGFLKWAEERLPVLSREPIADAMIRKEWVDLAVSYNERIRAYGQRGGIHLGTTLTAMLLTRERYYVINVGDTRAYEIADAVRVITKDQTVVAREVEWGNLTEEQAERDPRRSVLLQCIGASPEVYPDLFFGDVLPNAVYMLCSDGFRHEISREEIYRGLNPRVMLDAGGMEQNMRDLIALDKQRRERDNITVITVRTF